MYILQAEPQKLRLRLGTPAQFFRAEAAKQRQAATLPTKGAKRVPQCGVQIPPHKTESGKGVKTREVRAKAAGTNKDYINLAGSCWKNSVSGTSASFRVC
jgi:hypothetical protein